MVLVCTGCTLGNVVTTYNEDSRIKGLVLHQGILSQEVQKIKYKRSHETAATIELSQPVVVAQADQPEEWGFFQFPVIAKASDGTLIVNWHMREDSHTAYGTIGRDYTPMVSKDNGKTWIPQDKKYFGFGNGKGILKDGSVLGFVVPPCKSVSDFEKFPNSIAKTGDRFYYKTEDLPDELQGIFLQQCGENRQPQLIHAKVYDPGSIRCTIGGLYPMEWWGELIQMEDNSLVAGVYPCRYVDKSGNITRCGVSFFQSKDEGRSWSILGRIMCEADGIVEVQGDNEFTEPVFVVLSDSTFLCVMRSGSNSPMYKSFSSDKGKTWTTPVPFTPNGVFPQLVRLNNGILVLASGRPGVQIRFCLEGDGKNWTEPIEMLPYMKDNGEPDIFGTTCGYTYVLPVSDDSFCIVYSDFKSKNKEGELRKAIIYRKIKICTKR